MAQQLLTAPQQNPAHGSPLPFAEFEISRKVETSMPPVTAFLEQIRSSFIKAIITTDSRGITPGGAVILDLSRGHNPFATLLIRSIHPRQDQYSTPESYRITEITIDNAEVIKLRRPVSPEELWQQVEKLIQDRHDRAIDAMRNSPGTNHQRNGHWHHAHRSRRYQQRNRHAGALSRLSSNANAR